MGKFAKYLKEIREIDSPDIKIEFLALFNKIIADEISAFTLYTRLANEINGTGNEKFRSEMAEHATDELKHFQTLIRIAADRGLAYTINLTPDAMFPISDVSFMMDYTQNLETIAINDYTTLITFCNMAQLYDLEEEFRDILEDEAEHFDSIATLTGKNRKVFA